MILSPLVPTQEPDEVSGAVRRVLAVVGGHRRGDERTLRWACALAQEHRAELTVLCLWSFPPMWPWIALSGAGAAVQMLELHRRELSEWLRTQLCSQAAQPVHILTCRHPESASRIVAGELSRGDYTCVVSSRRAIGRRAARRLRRGRPELTLVCL
jgi:hypothetical protein